MRQLVEHGFAGSALVACGDDVVFSGDFGLGDTHSEAPSYWVASISKQFTAAAILKLAERGRLSVQDPLSRFFPEAPPDKAGITIFQLLTHQGGLGQFYEADGVRDRDAAARAIFASPLIRAPGSGFAYSNSGYVLLAMIVEIASGQRFERFVAHEIFRPGGVRDGGFWPDTAGAFTPPLLAPDGPPNFANWGFRGAIGMRASVPDLYRWTRALDAGGVLSEEGRTMLYGPHVRVSDGDGVGFNWFWTMRGDGRRLLWTRGTEDYGANVILYRLAGTPLVVVAATHAGPAEDSGPGWSRRARDALLAIYAPEGARVCGR
jgi:CubicO group peptidase (beta-lactamase class C family)